MGAIFNKKELDTFRFYASYYLHGHSVGGTNPALIEAMAAKAFIIIHDNPFNKSVISNQTYSFQSVNDLVQLLDDNNILKSREAFVKENLNIINEKYRWDLIVNKYERYFLEILNHKKV